MRLWGWLTAVSGALLIALLAVFYARETQKAELLILEHTRAHAQVVKVRLDDLNRFLTQAVEGYLANPAQNAAATRELFFFGQRIHTDVMDFFILDAQGRVAVWTREGAFPEIGDREYWLNHQTPGAKPVCVTRPLLSRVHKEPVWFIALSRGFRDKAGNLRAVGVVNLTIDALAAEVAAIESNRDDRTAALAHESGELIYRTPALKAVAPGERLPLLHGVSLPLAEPIVKVIDGSLDNKTRLGAVRTVEGYCLAVTSTLDMTQVMAPWRRWAAAAVALWLLLAGAGYWTVRRMGRLTREKITSEGIYRALFDHVADPIFLARPQGGGFEFTGANSALLQRSRGERIELEKSFAQALHRCYETRKPVTHEQEYGGQSWMTVISPVTDGGGRVALLVGISRDITAHKNRQALLSKQVENEVEHRLLAQKERDMDRQLLIQQSKMAEMGSMIGVIAHQWKQPLNVIALLVQSFEDDFDEGEMTRENLQTAIGRIMDQVRFMSQTVDDFRSFYKPGKTPELFSPKQAIDKTLELLAAQIKKHEIDVQMTVEGEGMVMGFPSEFKQVILNLVTNAKDAVAATGQKTPRIGISLRYASDSAVIVLCDNGGGIAQAYLPDKLFEPFVSTKGEAGAGVGLLLAKTIIEKKMGGTIRAYNEGPGACFEIILPLYQGENRES
ncbi:MAG: ATP-binding protein [Campylobacterales bacterium]